MLVANATVTHLSGKNNIKENNYNKNGKFFLKVIKLKL